MRSSKTTRNSRSAESRKVLMIAYAFPPTGGPGVQRPAKFAKYLPQLGWKPIIWTADHVEGLPVDRSLLEELPEDVQIHHPQALRGALTAARRALASVAYASIPTAAIRATRAVQWQLAQRAGQREQTDPSIAWAKRSFRPLLDLVESERPNVIWSTYSPASNHRLALELKRRLGVRWVADFRDLWTDDGRYREASPARRAADARLQQEILEQADAVVGVSPRQTQILADRLLDGCHKFVTITNGFDPEDFFGVAPQAEAKNGPFTITYAGRLDRVRAQPELIEGLRRFANDASRQGGRIALRIAGHAGELVLEQLGAAPLDLQFDGYVSHRQAIETMACADVLLLPMPRGRNGETIISGKVFEYLATGKPILVVGPEGGECERIVRECRAGVGVGFDAAAIAAALHQFHSAFRAGQSVPGCDEKRLHPYSRVALAKALAGIFDRLAAPKSRRSPKKTRELMGTGALP